MMRDARRGQFDVVLVWASDRIARSVKHFLEVLDELNRLEIEFVSFREQIDTVGPLGRAIVVIIGAIAELERSLIAERVRAGLRNAKAKGKRLGRPDLPPVVVPLLMLVREPSPMGGANPNSAAMGRLLPARVAGSPMSCADEIRCTLAASARSTLWPQSVCRKSPD